MQVMYIYNKKQQKYTIKQTVIQAVDFFMVVSFCFIFFLALIVELLAKWELYY